jgi:histidinol-phosphatase (PHP family)
MTPPLLYETHTHTPFCKHATGTPQEYAEVAQSRGLLGLFVTCHNPMPDGFSANVRMRPDQLNQYVELVAQASQEWAGRVDIRLGMEADYFPGYESWLQRQLESAEFHYILGSIHPQLQEYQDLYAWDDPVEVQRSYFRLLAEAAETGLFDSLSHPDIVKNMTAGDWHPVRIMDSIRDALDRIAAAGTAMELNTSGTNKTIAQMNPCPEILIEMQQRGIPVVIGADAHLPERVGDQFEQALELLEQCGYLHVSYFIERQRLEVSIREARASLLAVGTTALPGDWQNLIVP